MDKFFTKFAGRTAFLSGKPLTFILALTVVIVWAVSGPFFRFSEVWQLVINTGTTIVTSLMVFLIQNAQNRDAAAIQCKLDEIIRAIDSGRNEFIGIEHLGEKELIEIRDALEKECGQGDPGRHEGVGRLIERR